MYSTAGEGSSQIQGPLGARVPSGLSTIARSVPPSALQHVVQTLSLPKLQLHLRRCDPTPRDQSCGQRVLLYPLHSCRQREIITAETQSHPRGANARMLSGLALILAIQLSRLDTAASRPLPLHETREVSGNGCLFRAAEMAPRIAQVKTRPLSACHLVCRSCTGSWLSFVYPTGANAGKLAGHLWLSSGQRQLHLNLSASLRTDAPACERGHEHSAHVSQWGDGRGNLSEGVSSASCSERKASIVWVWWSFQKPSNDVRSIRPTYYRNTQNFGKARMVPRMVSRMRGI